MYIEAIKSQLQPSYFDASKIRDYELLMDDNFSCMVHFIARSDKHRLYRGEDGKMTVRVDEEGGKDYFYGEPLYAHDALAILEENKHESHKALAEKLRNFLN